MTKQFFSLPGWVLCFLLVAGFSESTNEELRLQRFQTLAEVWGRIYLLHPSVVRSDLKLDWGQVLLETIPRVEKAKTREEFVSVLNDSLLKPLKDPFAVARAVVQDVRMDHPASPVLSSKKLSANVGYIDASHPELYTQPKFIQEFYVYLQSLQSASAVVIDLRWQEPKFEYPDETFLRLFVDRPRFTGSFLSRVHEGWNENGQWSVYSQKWEVANGYPIEPIQNDERYQGFKTNSTPVIFLINNVSCFSFSEYLDLLQTSKNIAVIWERTGNVPNWQGISYPENIEVNFNVTHFFSLSGGLGFKPDFVSNKRVELAEIPGLATKALEVRKRAASTSSDLDLSMFYPANETVSVSNSQISREEKLLGLFKIWVVIKNFFPHLEFADVQWDSVLLEWIPKIEAPKDTESYYEVLKELATKLNDSHIRVSFSKQPQTKTEWGCVPMRFSKVEGKVILTAVKAEALQKFGIHVGDEVLEINGDSIHQYETSQHKTRSASTPQSFFHKIYGDLYWDKKGKELTLKIRTLEKGTIRLPLKYDLPDNAWEEDPAKAVHWKVMNQRIGYINMTTTPTLEDFDGALEALARTDGLILDVRGYPDFNAQASVSRLSDVDVRSTLFEVPILKANSRPENSVNVSHYIIKPVEKPKYRKPIVALINERAISAAEDYCIYLRNAKRVTFVGSRTTGTNGNVTNIDLPAGGKMYFTGMRVKFADGTRFQNIGIVPDVEVKPTIQGIIQGKDEILEKGVETIERLITKK